MEIAEIAGSRGQDLPGRSTQGFWKEVRTHKCNRKLGVGSVLKDTQRFHNSRGQDWLYMGLGHVSLFIPT